MFVRQFDSYQEALVVSYEEEIAGAAYFSRLADFHDGRANLALSLMADIETITARYLEPLILQCSLVVKSHEQLTLNGRQEAEIQKAVSWHDLVGRMADTYPVFVDEFEGIKLLAPVEDKEIMAVLIAHEVAALAFANAERMGQQYSTDHLHAFIATYKIQSS